MEEEPNSLPLEESKSIKPIDRGTVHRICSGQVVLSLAIAVKELIENAIDAGATTIEIRLKEYGSELIEVIDNGCGVEEVNFEALTLKHHTSKIRQFSDLSFVSTLGFRGEALSSLCALADLTVTTKHKSMECGMRIEYDHNGHIKTKNPCARQIGTTVSLSNLFSTLPVRFKDFTKNLKREFSKMLELLYAYCVISDVRFICSNQTKKTPRTVVVQTPGGKTLRENIISVFGSKQMETLIEFELHRPSDEILEEFSIKLLPQELLPFQFKGYISKCMHGCGRSSSDRQYYYVNSRPCVPTKLIKVTNEVYRSFNVNQYPFVVLNILIEQKLVDVNVTPDKRQVFMENEKLLVATLKMSLLEMFKQYPSTFKMQNVVIPANKEVSLEAFKHFSQANQKQLDPPKGVKRKTCSANKVFDKQAKGILNFLNEQKRQKIDLSDDSGSEDEEKQLKKFVKESYNSEDSDNETFNISTQDINNTLIDSLTDLVKRNKNEVNACDQSTINENVTLSDTNRIITIITPEDTSSIHENQIGKKIGGNDIIDETEYNNTNCIDETENDGTNIIDETINYDESPDPVCVSNRRNIVAQVSLKSIQEKIQNSLSRKSESKETSVRFRSKLTSQSADLELQKNISKEMFGKMEIIGQFNKGFVITRLDSDLFIIDQHASDEKYNYETLQKNTVLQNQQLICPLPLDLTAANENLLIDNLDIFTKNGFKFSIDENAPPRKKVSLTSIPVSKNIQFGKEDIEELLFILQEDSTSNTIRPSRVSSMFASRACRKSVMIGDVLSKRDMRRIVNHMGQIDQPWNCPHGRPTMRHLVNLDLLLQ